MKTIGKILLGIVLSFFLVWTLATVYLADIQLRTMILKTHRLELKVTQMERIVRILTQRRFF